MRGPARAGNHNNTKGYTMSTSSIILVGNITKDPVLRFSPNGTATASFSIAVNRKLFRSANAANGPNPPPAAVTTQETVSYYNVVAWQSLAENVCESLHKGDRVVITGRLDQRSWVNKDAERRVSYEIVAEEVGPSLRWVSALLQKPARSAAPDVPLHTEPRRDAEASSPFGEMRERPSDDLVLAGAHEPF
jgi:single-strand DNA-binding protein